MKLFEPLTVGTLRLKNRTVVLACGDHARTDLHASLPGRVPELHLVGDRLGTAPADHRHARGLGARPPALSAAVPPPGRPARHRAP